jgi:SAM-dependent methyltransferase
LYRAVIEGDLLPREGTLLDLGCGGGLMLAVLASARVLQTSSTSSSMRLVGMETRMKAAAVARRALAGDAEIVTDDVRHRPLPSARAVLLFDVLSMMRAADQDALLAAVLAALEPGGVLLVREADAGAGGRFHTVNLGNRLKAWASGRSARDFQFRTLADWRRWLEQAGFAVEVRPMGMGTPFGNVLLVARRGS